MVARLIETGRKFKQSDRLLLSLLLLAGVPITLILLPIYWPSASSLLVTSLTALLLLFFAFSFIRVREAGVVQPIFVLLVSLFFGYFGKLVYVLSDYGESLVIDQHLLLDQGLSHQESGVLIITVTTCFFLASYMLPNKRPVVVPAIIHHWFATNRALIIGIVLFLFCSGCFLLYVLYYGGGGEWSSKRFGGDDVIPSDRFNEISYFVFKSALLIKVSFYIFLLCFFSSVARNRRLLSAILAFLSAGVFLALSSYFSNRAGVLVVMLDFLIISYLMTGRILVRNALIIGVVVTVVILSVSIFRSDLGSQKSIMEHVFGGRYFFELTRNTHLYEYLSSGNSLLDFNSDVFEGIVQYANLGRLSGEKVFLMDGSGVPLGFPMEMFAIGGWPMMLIAMVALGLIARKLCVLVAKPIVNDYEIVVYSVLVTRLMVYMFNNGIGVTGYQILIDLVPFLLIVMFVKWKEPPICNRNKKHSKMEML